MRKFLGGKKVATTNRQNTSATIVHVVRNGTITPWAKVNGDGWISNWKSHVLISHSGEDMSKAKIQGS